MSSNHTRWKDVFTHNMFPYSLVSLLLSFLPPSRGQEIWVDAFHGWGVVGGRIRGSLRVFEVGQ